MTETARGRRLGLSGCQGWEGEGEHEAAVLQGGSRAGLLSPGQKRLIHPVWALGGFKNSGGESSEMSSVREGKRTRRKAFVTDLKYAEGVVLKKRASLFQKVTIVVPKSPEERLWQVGAILGGLPRWHLRGFPSVGNGTPRRRRRRRVPARHRGRGDPSCPRAGQRCQTW